MYTSSQAEDQNQDATVERAFVTLRGSVQKILPSVGKDGCDRAEILIVDAEPLYQEVRIKNLLKSADGTVLPLDVGSQVEVTITFRKGKK